MQADGQGGGYEADLALATANLALETKAESRETKGYLETSALIPASAKIVQGSLEEGVALVGKESAEEEILPKFEEKKMQVEEEVPFVGLELVVECDGGFGEAAHGVEIEMANAHDR